MTRGDYQDLLTLMREDRENLLAAIREERPAETPRKARAGGGLAVRKKKTTTNPIRMEIDRKARLVIISLSPF